MISKAMVRDQLLKKLIVPTYEYYTILYVTNANEADITISKDHNIFDYLAIGIIGLFKSIYTSTDTKKTIKIAYKKYPNIDRHVLNNGILVFNPLSNLNKECARIMECYYDAHIPNSLKSLSGTYLSSMVSKSYLNNSSDLQFDDFHDTIQAQKKAFNLLMYSNVQKWIN